MLAFILLVSAIVWLFVWLVFQAAIKVMGWRWFYFNVYLYLPSWKFTRWIKGLIWKRCKICGTGKWLVLHHKNYDHHYLEWLFLGDKNGGVGCTTRKEYKMRCLYCGTDEQVGKVCGKCGAPLTKPEAENKWESAPFFYNGYIVYQLQNYSEDTFECQFWLGMNLIERIKVNRIILEKHVKEYESCMTFFWEWFLLAHGEKEVVIWQEENTKYPASFEVRRIENPQKEYLETLSFQDIINNQR